MEASLSELVAFFQTILRNPYLILVSICCGLSDLIYCFHTGVIGGAIIFMRDDFKLGHETIFYDVLEHCITATAVLGAPGGGYLADVFGRKRMVLAAAGFSMVGSCVMALAPLPFIILGGRLLIGVSVGMLSCVSNVFLTEASPASIRGGVMLLNSLYNPAGRVLAYLVISFFPMLRHPWRYMLGVGAVLSLIQILLSLMLTETPVFLIKEGSKDKARMAIERTHAMEHVEKEMDLIISFVRDQDDNKVTSHSRRTLKKGILLGSLLHLIRNLAGMNLVLFCSPMILQIAGLTSKNTSLITAVAIGSCALIGSLMATALSDKVQRKKMFLFSMYLALLGNSILGIIFLISEGCKSKGVWAGCPTAQGIIAAVVASVLFILSFPTLSAVPGLLSVELQPYKYRGFGTGVAEAIGFLTNLAVSSTLSATTQKIKEWGSFALYASLTACAIVLLHLIVLPVTTGVPLEKIEEDLTNKN